MVRAFFFFACMVTAALMSAQQKVIPADNPVLLVLVSSQDLSVPVKKRVPEHLRRTYGYAVVALCSHCDGDSTEGPIVRGRRGDQIITYIEELPVRGAGTALSVRAVASFPFRPVFTGISAEFENACESPKAVFK